MEAIRRLRGLGMNMVFFDVVTRSPYADGVLLDNRDAIASLHDALRSKGANRIGYVGWDNAAVLSAREREQAASEQTPTPAFVRRIDWRDKNRLGQIAETIANEIKSASAPPDALLCGDGEIGVAIRKALLSRGLDTIRVASPDEYPDSRALSITVYRQDFEKLAEQTFNCLLAQNRPGWSASVFPIRGELVEPAAAD
jgi:DNA-binding LacI/PurR family transcriptional regulator